MNIVFGSFDEILLNGRGVEDTIGIGGIYCLNGICGGLSNGVLVVVVDEKPFRSLVCGAYVVVIWFDCADAIEIRFGVDV